MSFIWEPPAPPPTAPSEHATAFWVSLAAVAAIGLVARVVFGG